MPALGIGAGTFFRQDVLARRPVAEPSLEGYFFFATDVNGGTSYQCDGISWLPVTSGLRDITAGSNISIVSSPTIITITSTAAPYILPLASSTVLGGVKSGSGLSITGGGVLSTTYSLPTASASVLGGIKVGANLSITGDGTLSASLPYTLPIASASVLGGIKVGSGLSIDGTGILSNTFIPTDATTSAVGVVEIDQNPAAGHPIVVTVRTIALVASVAAVANPTTAPTLSATNPSSPTSLLAGTYNVGYLWVTPEGGRTILSHTASILITAGQGIQAVSPSLPAGVSKVEFYTSDCYGPGNSREGGTVYQTYGGQARQGGSLYQVIGGQARQGGSSYT